MREEWRDIKGYEGIYQVSNLGNIKSLPRYDYRGHLRKEKHLKKKEHQGYLFTKLYKNGIYKMKPVHRLVAQAFIPNPENYPEVNHKDENPSNPRMDNLEWCTSKYNSNYGTRSKRIAEKLSRKVYQYSAKGQLIKTWDSTMQAEREGNFNSRRISECCNKKGITHKEYIWSYTEL